MDYYQGVVSEYLRANRATFINTEFCIQLSSGKAGFAKGAHWFCDAVALSFAEKTIYLCEVTFAINPAALQQRLLAWSKHWAEVQTAVRRDGHFDGTLDDGWQVKPWIFVPEQGQARFKEWERTANLNFQSKITTLEETQPWKYRSWDREIQSETLNPEPILK
jgi:hypothetical protein